MLTMKLLVSSLMLVCVVSASTYWSERQRMIDIENAQMLGHDIKLNWKEEVVNKYLMDLKIAEYDEGFNDPVKFLPSRNFFEVKEQVEQSKVFQFIREMPKGALLHTHDNALPSFDVLYNLTLRENVYACTVNNLLQLKFMASKDQDSTCDWELVEELRKNNSSYDAWLKSQLTLKRFDGKWYNDLDEIWTKFANIFKTVNPFFTYRPALETFMYQALKELYDDNVMYMEFRGTLPPVYELDGRKLSPVDSVGAFRHAVELFKRDYPDFAGARFIYSNIRLVSKETVREYVNLVNELHRVYPDFVVGFDLVGQEDKGYPLADFVDELRGVHPGLNRAFHVAETNWYGTSTDFNLYDAILLGAKRLGHAFALTKHPFIMEEVKKRHIAVEVQPISHQILMLVQDLRNHPAAILIGQDVPVVISNDDPTYWDTKGLSYDFYMTFLGIASRNSDLRLLKKLAQNSIQFSFIPRPEKRMVWRNFHIRWNQFINKMYRQITTTQQPRAL